MVEGKNKHERYFGREKYSKTGTFHNTKIAAKEKARRLRVNGYKVRIVEGSSPKRYVLYIRRK